MPGSTVRVARARALTLALALAIGGGSNAVLAQPGGGETSARDAAPIDLTGTWVSVVFEDWKFRMVTPGPGIFDGIPLNGEGRRVGEAWSADTDAAACKAYGAPAIMRIPGRFRISWADDETLRIETDQGEQTRLLHFSDVSPAAPSRQGRSIAEWMPAPRGGGSLKVTTDNLLPGYMSRNGAPYSERAELTEYFDMHALPNGDVYLTITTRVTDPVYFTGPDLKSTDLRRLPNDREWSPVACGDE